MSKIHQNSWLGRSLAAQRLTDWKLYRVIGIDLHELTDGFIKIVAFMEDAKDPGPLRDVVFILPKGGQASHRFTAFTRAAGIEGNPNDTTEFHGRFLAIRGRGDLPGDFAPLDVALKAAA